MELCYHNTKGAFMETPVLSDKNIFPSDEIIYSYIGKSKALWISAFDYIHEKHPDIEEQWRYYNDGKSWLMKVTRKTKTIFWLSLFEKSFRITFYFTAKAEEVISDSKLSDELKKQFVEAKTYGKIRPLTITFKNKKDVEFLKELITIKLSLK
jgi:hypothetical protein